MEKTLKLFGEIKKQCWPGFYEDLNGTICCSMNGYLISIWINTDTNEVDITLDDGRNGFFDNNIEWETVQTLEEAKNTVRRFGILCYE